MRRGGEKNPDDPGLPRTGGEEVTLSVPPQGMKRLGIVTGMSAIVAVQQNSPAASAGIQPGDVLLAVDGASTEELDPTILSNLMANAAGEGRDVALSIERGEGDAAETLEIAITPRQVDWLESAGNGGPISVPELGIAYNLSTAIRSVVSGSPAAEAGLEAGDKLLSAKLTIPKTDSSTSKKGKTKAGKPDIVPIKLADTENWSLLLGALQKLPAGSTVELTVDRDGKEKNRVASALR